MNSTTPKVLIQFVIIIIHYKIIKQRKLERKIGEREEKKNLKAAKKKLFVKI